MGEVFIGRVMFNKPWYAFRPTQIPRRLRLAEGEQTVPVPWGRLTVDSRESVGSAIARNGVYELAVSELIARLTDPGETAVDVGANIGYMTSLLASRVGPGGRVIAFEPHPEIAPRLQANAPANVTVRQAAVTSEPGTAHLGVPAHFAGNHGVSTLAEEGIEVSAVTLDDEISDDIGVLKIDVEGHELGVLDGAARLLARVRDVIFEDHAYPSLVSERLHEHGYTLLGLRQSFWGVQLVAPEDARTLWDAPTYLATRDPERARARTGWGWRVLRAAP